MQTAESIQTYCSSAPEPFVFSMSKTSTLLSSNVSPIPLVLAHISSPLSQPTILSPHSVFAPLLNLLLHLTIHLRLHVNASPLRTDNPTYRLWRFCSDSAVCVILPLRLHPTLLLSSLAPLLPHWLLLVLSKQLNLLPLLQHRTLANL